MTMDATQTQQPPPKTRRKAVVAACIGNFIEYYDFTIYGYFAVIIASLFLPATDPTAALLATFAVFALSYVARPLGGVIFGHLGDKYGRRTPLAVAVILIAVSTTVIGLLPTYAQIGVAAPILLVAMRLIQGVSVGGEFGGVASYIAEYAPIRRRALYTCWTTFTIGLALFAGALVATILTTTLSQDSLESWGWRVPFLIGMPLGLVGLYLRLKLEDTPAFDAAVEDNKVEKSPLVKSITDEWRSILLGMGVVLVPAITIYLFFVYSPTYLTVVVGYDAGKAQLANIIALAFYCALIPPVAILCDRIGRRPILMAGSGMIVVLTYPGYVLLGQGQFGSVVLGLCLFGVGLATYAAALTPTLAELFPTKVRYSGLSLSWNVPLTALGGTAPLIATYLIAQSGNVLAPAFFAIAGGVGSFVTALLLKETNRTALR